MNDPSEALQRAIHAALTGDPSLQLLIGSPARVWDRPPANPVFPYITIGDDQVMGQDVQWTEDSLVYATVHGWSRKSDRGEVKRIGGCVRDILIVPFAIEGFTILYGKLRDGLTKEEPDGLTFHGIQTFEFRLSPAA
jgi:hypothetical protein